MRVTHLEIRGFGAWTGLRVEGLGDQLNVLYGPNEAGKTTLLQFIRSMFYGLSAERRKYLPPVHGGQGGGTIGVKDDNGRFTVERLENAGGDEVAIHGADGTRHGEHLLKVLLANIDEATFNNVFAIGLREIQELGALSDTDAASMLYSLTAGLDRVSLVEVMRELDVSRNRILDRDGKPCQVVQLLADRKAIRAEIDELSALGRRYARIAAERHDLDGEIKRLEEESHRAEYQAQGAELALNLRDRWQERGSLDAQIASLGSDAGMPPGMVERFEGLAARIKQRSQQLEQLRSQQEETRLEIDSLAVNETVARQAARIEALCEQEPWLVDLQSQVGRLEKEVADLEGKLAAEQERLGLGNGAAGGLPELSSRTQAALKSPGRDLADVRRRLAEAEQSLVEANASATQLAQQMEQALASRGQPDLATALDRAGSLVAQLRRRAQVDSRIDQMARYQDELEEKGKRLLERQLLPMPVIAGLGGVFALGVMLFLIGLLLPGSVTGSFGLGLAVVGIAGSATAAGGKILLERSNLRQSENVRSQLAMLQTQLQQTREERTSMDARLAVGEGQVAARLDAAEKELAFLQDLAPVESRRGAANQEVESATRRKAQTETEYAAAKKRWRSTLRAAGLPRNLRPQQVRRIFGRREQISQWQRSLVQRREELGQRQRELDALCGRVTQVASEAGMDAGKPIDQLRGLAAQLARQQAAAAQRGVFRSKLKKLRRIEQDLNEKIGRLRRRRKSLLLECGADDEQEFLARAANAVRSETLRKQRAALEREIEAAVAGKCPMETIRSLLEGNAVAQLHQRRDDLLHRAATLEGELRQRLEKRGQLAEQLATLAGDRRLAMKQLELAMVERRLEDAVRHWQKLAVTCRILDQIRTTYEHERQPETLQEASQYLLRLTDGHYRRVWTPLGEQVLKVEDASGHSMAVENLSRGTREQLFLSLRLALASWYARHGASLPLVLDDVLVNFDAVRTKAAAAVLRDFAATGRQLLIFTCHEHIFKLFASLKAPVGKLPPNTAASPEPVRFQQPPKRVDKPEKPDKAARKLLAPARPAPIEDGLLPDDEEAGAGDAGLGEAEDRAEDMHHKDDADRVPVRTSRKRASAKKSRASRSGRGSDKDKRVFDVDFFESETDEEDEEEPEVPFDFEFEDPADEEEESDEAADDWADEEEKGDDGAENK